MASAAPMRPAGRPRPSGADASRAPPGPRRGGPRQTAAGPPAPAPAPRRPRRRSRARGPPLRRPRSSAGVRHRAGPQVDARERRPKGRQRLHGAPHDHRQPVRGAPLDAPPRLPSRRGGPSPSAGDRILAWPTSPRAPAANPRPSSTPRTAWIPMQAAASRDDLLLGTLWPPGPAGTPVATTSTTPPSVSPRAPASAMRARPDLRGRRAERVQVGRVAADPRGLGSSRSCVPTSTPPIATTCPRTEHPRAARNDAATAPAATSTAVSRARALAISRASRTLG